MNEPDPPESSPALRFARDAGGAPVGAAVRVRLHGEVRDVAVSRARVVVGRAPSADVCVRNACVARQHCAIDFSDEGFFAVRPGSSRRAPRVLTRQRPCQACSRGLRPLHARRRPAQARVRVRETNELFASVPAVVPGPRRVDHLRETVPLALAISTDKARSDVPAEAPATDDADRRVARPCADLADDFSTPASRSSYVRATAMGQPDQLAKRILHEETPAATGQRAVFDVAPEVPSTALTPDGVVRVVEARGLDALPAPWSRVRVEVTVDVKMPGDPMSAEALGRCELRRQARWVNLLASRRMAPKNTSATNEARKAPDPRDYGTWVVAPYVPQWLTQAAEAQVLELQRMAPGCWRVGPGVHETLWIAANELPLRAGLLPLRVARSGEALWEFLLWSATVKGVDWTRNVVRDLGMSATFADEVLPVPTDEAEQYRIKTAYTRKLLQFYPDAADEILEKGIEKGAGQALARLFERRLARALTSVEHAVLTERLRTLGTPRLSDLVFDLEAAALDAWLRDPDAT